MTLKKERGDKAEALAARHLEGRGMKIIARNHRDRTGELDIIALEGKTLCVIEVRSRWEPSAYLPEQGLGPGKIKKLYKTTARLLQKHRLSRLPVRMDLMVIDWAAGNPEIRFYPASISAGGQAG